MLFLEVNRGKCKTYLVGCVKTRRAMIIDPLKERVDRCLALLAYHGYRLQWVVDTHTHADHHSGVWDLCELTGARAAMHERAPAPHIDVHVQDGDKLTVGELQAEVLYTPGHTPDGISLHFEDRVFTGDTILIHGTGRADFAGGDPGAQYDSITQKLFSLPEETMLFPAHDYRGHVSSTIGDEKRNNPRLAGRSRVEYIELMNNLNLPLPDKIQEALQMNQSAIEDESLQFPSLAQLNHVRQLSTEELKQRLSSSRPPILLDVREADEFDGELGHIPGAMLVPLRDLTARADELTGYKDQEVVVICRAGVRSATAAAILAGLGFEHVFNLKGGMLDWRK